MYASKYQELTDWLSRTEDKMKRALEHVCSVNSQTELDKTLNSLKQLSNSKPQITSLLHSSVELGEKLYATTSAEGREVIRNQLENAQTRTDAIFDSLTKAERDLQSKLTWYDYFLFWKP